MEKLKDIQQELIDRQPLSIGYVDELPLFTGFGHELKHKMSREEWDEICECEVVDKRQYFDLYVVELKK